MPKSKKVTKKRTAAKRTAPKKPTASKKRRTAKRPSSNILTIASLIAVIVISAWLALASVVSRESNTAPKDAAVRALILKATRAAESGTPQEALDAYEAVADAAEKSGDKATQATADANASTYQALLDGEKYNQQLNEQAREGGVTADSK